LVTAVADTLIDFYTNSRNSNAQWLSQYDENVSDRKVSMLKFSTPGKATKERFVTSALS